VLSRVVYKKQRGRRWLTALATLTLVTGTFVISSTASGFTTTNFELDRDATSTQDAALAHLGGLKSAINSTSATTFVVCELVVAPTTPFTIQIDAERMTVTSVASTTVSTGGCAFANPADVPIDARTWTATRGVDGTTAATHTGSTPRNNVTLVTSTTGHDWDQVHFDQVNDNDCATSGADACVWKNRPNTGTASSSNDFTGPTTFTQTSGDLETISQWRWTNQSVPDADEINDAFAAKYDGPPQELMFGMDRNAVNGTKDIGFWFFHQAVGPLDDGTFSGAHCAAGQTTDGCTAPAHGDILILTTFTAGGGTTTVRAYEWVGSGGSDGALDFLATFGDCVPAGSGNACATTANSTVPAPWPHTEKPTGASADTFYASGFMEGGINLTAAGLEGCFASFMGVSRSSAQLTAQPKAFVLGHFESCGSTLTTTPKASDGTTNLAADTNSNNLVEASIGTGSVSVKDSALLTVTGTSTFTGTLSFHICGPIPSGTCATGGVLSGSSTVTANGTYASAAASLTSVGRYCWRADFVSGTTGVPDAHDSSAESAGPPSSTGECFEVLPVTPTLTTTAWSSGDSNGHAQTTAVDFGNPVYDKANLTGAATQPGTNGGSDPGQPGNTYPSINANNGAAAGGTIQFTLKGPDTVGPPAVCSTTNAGKKSGSTGSNPETVNVSGNGAYFTSGFTPDAPGNYHWVAVYTPAAGPPADPNNIGSTHNADCSNSGENVVVSQVPTTISTRQFVFPQDKASIDTNPTGLTLSGNVTFRLFGPTGGGTPKTGLENCQADDGTGTANGLAYSEGPLAVSGAGPQTKTTNNTSFRITGGDTYYWNVTYTSSTAAQLGSSSSCSESTAVTYAGNDTGIAIP